MTTKYDDLARLAEAATQGLWAQQRDTVKLGRRNIATVHAGVSLGIGESYRQACANAAYIAAANPANIKALLADRDALAEALARLLKSFPTDGDMKEAGYDDLAIDEACAACEAGHAALARVKEPT
ncbi:hypothetical protein IMZ29_00990 [Achromobacter sp. GG226]|uniref:hypothetical protein n=1 Tax=Verticiella alkaliphila TaxID=2779529 RepID=UPI001C0BCD51|nr:hypothetical protein [Verticiella sp. GG226]MBU4609179.1 hypothetical protein [Verticiella sp. GG226]